MAGFGVRLAAYESGTEIEGNNAMLVAPAPEVNFSAFENTVILRLPTICMEQYFEDGQNGANNTTTFESRLGLAVISGGIYLMEDAVDDTHQKMDGYMIECSNSYAPSCISAMEVRNNAPEAFESLGFN